MNSLKKIIQNNSIATKKTIWHKSITVRAAILAWILIIGNILIFVIGILPTQKKIMEERMSSEANDIASSIGQVTATAIINNDYAFTVEHCLKIIKESNSILYIIITRKDGFSLVHTAGEWRLDTLKNDLVLPNSKNPVEKFLFSNLVKQNVFHYSYPFNYSGIDWGRINVGLSLKEYNQSMSELKKRTVFLAIISILLGLIASLFFARTLTKPILQLDYVSQSIADGNLNARVKIKSENELGNLASTFNKMTESLKASQEELENKVELRTAELAKTNSKLQNEIKEKLLAEKTLKEYNSRLEVFDKIYRGIISAKSTKDIIIETITHFPILFNFINTTAVAIIDVKTDSVIINGVRINQVDENSFFTYKLPINPKFDVDESSPLNQPRLVGDLRLIENKNPMENDIFNDGLVSYISVPLEIDNNKIGTLSVTSKTPNVFNNNHLETLLYLSNQLAVAIHQAQLQSQIKIHADSLQNSLSEKEVLLKEIHHRVKNNLQVISSLLYLNSKKIKDKDALEMFKESQNRVKSIALVHERLYQSKDLGKIDFKEYVVKLTNDLFRSFAINASLVKLNININNIYISIDTAVPCGLIINELISNSLKYAFPEIGITQNDCNITIDFNKNGNNELILQIYDNGKGLPEGLDISKTQSLGLQLVDTLVAQLEGTLDIKNSNGASFTIKFKDESI